MSRLIVVSNRLSIVDNNQQPTGGLSVALHAALTECGGIWYGWNGKIAKQESNDIEFIDKDNISYACIQYTKKEHEYFYNRFCNAVLWPLMHYRLGLMHYAPDAHEMYKKINRKFAEGVAKIYQPGDMIWAHDFHLFPFAYELKKRLGEDVPIGFFLHTPFPSPEIFEGLPKHTEIMKCFMDYDVIGFQTHLDLDHFCRYAIIHLGAIDRSQFKGRERHLTIGNKTIIAKALPISIDTKGIMAMSQEQDQSDSNKRMRSSLGKKQLIIGVDRLDYSKGLPNRLEAFEKLLELYPKFHNAVSMLQISPPSRIEVPDYNHLTKYLERQSGAINGKYSLFDWVPIRYMNQNISRQELTGFMRASSIGFITPLRDGMNLVAKEYVASQNPENPGVLVLSKFAGAAQELKEALIVNPYDIHEMAEALSQALSMPLWERKQRYETLMENLYKNHIGLWYQKFIESLQNIRNTKKAA